MSAQPSSAQLAQDTLALCAIPSVTGQEAGLADYVMQRLAHADVTCLRIGNCVVARRASAIPTAPCIALLGHLDTVRPAPPAEQPLCIASDRVYGCGASDMKGGLAVMLALLTDPVPLAHPLLCVFYDKEEGPSDESGILPILQSGVLHDAQLALCLEPTDGIVHAGCVGGFQIRVTALGRRAHSARPWQEDNAVLVALPFLQRLAQLSPVEVTVAGLSFFDVTTVTQAITTNSRNVVPDRLVLNVNHRFAPDRSLETARQQILAQLLAATGGDPRLQIEILDEAPPGAVCVDQPLLAAWLARERIGLAAKQAWTDVARLTAHGIPAVNFGPGQTDQAHQAHESVSIPALQDHHQRLLRLLRPSLVP